MGYGPGYGPYIGRGLVAPNINGEDTKPKANGSKKLSPKGLPPPPIGGLGGRGAGLDISLVFNVLYIFGL